MRDADRRGAVMDEFSLIARIEGMARGRMDPRVVVGIGDDAAVLAPRGRVVVTTDAFLEGVHFRLDLLGPRDAGFRAVAGTLSDLAAMGASPLAVVAALEVPAGEHRTCLSLMRGVADAAARFEAPLVGGNVTGTTGALGLTLTAVGEAGERVLLRSGARPGDDVLVTGRPGAAALGLTLLRDHRQMARRFPALVRAWRRPIPRLREGLSLVDDRRVHAAIDVSDGLLADLQHVLDASGVGAVVDADLLPIADEARRFARSVGLDEVEAALVGGDDYELLVTAEPGFEPAGFTRIGRITRGRGLRVLRGGSLVALPRRRGWDHLVTGVARPCPSASPCRRSPRAGPPPGRP